jgi:hypothetical protein
MKPPIIAVDADGEVMIFMSQRAAETTLEVNDLIADEYKFYDGEGRLLKAFPRGERNELVLVEAEHEASHQASVVKVLSVALPKLPGAPSELRGWGFQELIQLASKYAKGS